MCVERAVLRTGIPAREQQRWGLSGSRFLLCLLCLRVEKGWAAKIWVLVLSFSPVLLSQSWPFLLSLFCVSCCQCLEPNTASYRVPVRVAKAANIGSCNMGSSEKWAFLSNSPFLQDADSARPAREGELLGLGSHWPWFLAPREKQ